MLLLDLLSFFFHRFLDKDYERLASQEAAAFLLGCYFILISPLEFVEHVNNVTSEKFILQIIYNTLSKK